MVNHTAVPTADETGGFQNFFLPLFLTSQVSKGVDDNTKYEVEHDDNDDKEEQKVIHYPGSKQRFLDRPGENKMWRKYN